MAIDEGDGLVCLSVGKPDFRDRLHRATGRTLHMPTLAERVSREGGTAIAISNVSPGAAYFLDPDGYGWVYNPAGSYGPARRPLPAENGLAITKGEAGDMVGPSGSARGAGDRAACHSAVVALEPITPTPHTARVTLYRCAQLR
jgi:hypothetical protein